jgi:hypothetical protein
MSASAAPINNRTITREPACIQARPIRGDEEARQGRRDGCEKVRAWKASTFECLSARWAPRSSLGPGTGRSRVASRFLAAHCRCSRRVHREQRFSLDAKPLPCANGSLQALRLLALTMNTDEEDASQLRLGPGSSSHMRTHEDFASDALSPLQTLRTPNACSTLKWPCCSSTEWPLPAEQTTTRRRPPSSRLSHMFSALAASRTRRPSRK